MATIPGVYGKVPSLRDFVSDCGAESPEDSALRDWLHGGVRRLATRGKKDLLRRRWFLFSATPDSEDVRIGVLTPSTDAAGRDLFPFVLYHVVPAADRNLAMAAVPGAAARFWLHMDAVIEDVRTAPTPEEFRERLAEWHVPLSFRFGYDTHRAAKDALEKAPCSAYLGTDPELRGRRAASAYECGVIARENGANLGVLLPWPNPSKAAAAACFWTDLVVRRGAGRPEGGYTLVLPPMPPPPPTAEVPLFGGDAETAETSEAIATGELPAVAGAPAGIDAAAAAEPLPEVEASDRSAAEAADAAETPATRPVPVVEAVAEPADWGDGEPSSPTAVDGLAAGAPSPGSVDAPSASTVGGTAPAEAATSSDRPESPAAPTNAPAPPSATSTSADAAPARDAVGPPWALLLLRSPRPTDFVAAYDATAIDDALEDAREAGDFETRLPPEVRRRILDDLPASRLFEA